MTTRICAMACLPAHLTAAQVEPDVIVVEQFMRFGAHYSSVVEAVAAARPNGTIIVLPGGYGLPVRVPVVVDKPLRIIGCASASGVSPGVLHPIEIRALDSSGVVEVRGLSINQSCFGQCTGDGLQIHDCAGTVILDDVSVYGGPFPGREVSIKRCANVYLREVILDAGEDPILIEQSTVVCEQTSLISGAWTFRNDPPPRTTVRLGRGADVTLIRSEIVGENPWWPQSALAMDGGIVRADGLSALASEPLVAIGIAPQGAPASGTIWLDPGTFIQGARSASAPGGVFVPPGIRVIGAPVRVVDATPAYPGGSYTAQLRGADPAIDWFAAIVASPVATPPFPGLHPSIGTGPQPDYAEAWMDPVSSTVIYFGPPTGQVTQPVGMVPYWTTTVLQGVFFGSDNVLRLTPPFHQIVADPDR